MKKIILFTLFVLFTFSLYALPPKPYDREYKEVYTVHDALNSYDGVTCIINGKLTYMNDDCFDDRYILNDGKNQIVLHIPHHVIAGISDLSGNFKIVGEIGGARYPNHITEPHRDKHIDIKDINHNKRDIHIKVRYVEKIN